jgi:single-strand DNA-binding protein
MSLPTLTGVGRLTDDPELRFTPSGKAVAKVRLAFSDRKKDDAGQWVDGDTAFIDASVWGDEAEHVAESLQRGHEVLVSGKFKQREYVTKDGEKRTVYELAFATVAPTLRYATAKVSKMQRSSGGAQSQPAQGGGFDDPWSTGGANGPSRGQPADDSPPF